MLTYTLDDSTNGGYDPDHTFSCELREIDGGKMDGFTSAATCGDPRNYALAASGGFRPLLETNARHFEAAMNTNVRSLLFLVQAAMPLLERKEGRAKVVTLSSHGSRMALPMYGMIGTSTPAIWLSA